jgi:hypothetical protein
MSEKNQQNQSSLFPRRYIGNLELSSHISFGSCLQLLAARYTSSWSKPHNLQSRHESKRGGNESEKKRSKKKEGKEKKTRKEKISQNI